MSVFAAFIPKFLMIFPSMIMLYNILIYYRWNSLNIENCKEEKDKITYNPSEGIPCFEMSFIYLVDQQIFVK